MAIHSVKCNVLLSIWRRLTRFELIDDRTADDEYQTWSAQLSITASGPEQTVSSLSGGNQQKTVLAKVLSAGPSVLMLDEPTAGIDVATKRDVLARLRTLADEGRGVILVSSDFAEIADVCDRVLILRRGRVTSVLDRSQGDVITEKDLTSAVQATA